MATENDYNSYKALIAKSPHACELCDQQFDNRYSSIVHNSSHIIIPLLKYQGLYCEICYMYFTSTNDFNAHLSDKHRPIINNHNIEFDIRLPEIKLEKLPYLNGGNTFRVKEEVEGDFEGDEYGWSSSEDETLLEEVKRETETKYMQNEFEIKNEEEYEDFINSQLKFEVDDEYSGLLEDFDIENSWSNDENNDNDTYNRNKSIMNSIVYEDPVDQFQFEDAVPPVVPLKADEENESVHYSDLMTFGFFCCKYCYKYFSNRFSLIVHETTHMRINKVRRKNLLVCPQCDVYIAGNYRTVQKHEAAVHGTIHPKKWELQKCATCGLRYRNYTSHIKNYHSKTYEPHEISKKTVKDLVKTVQERVQVPILMQELLKGSIQMPVEVLLHEPDQKPILEPILEPVQETVLEPIQEPIQKPLPGDWIEKFFTIKVCDLCFSFFKSSFKKVYIYKGTFSYNTERPCDECKKIFFKLKTVRTIIRIHKSQMNRGSARNTNKERLKKIQIRLKMINKLGKMPRDRKRKTDIGQHTEEEMLVALVKVSEGQKLRAVPRTMNIPYTTLYRYNEKIKKSSSHDPIATEKLTPNYSVRKVFTEVQEKDMSNYIKRCSNMFYGLTLFETRKLAYEMAISINIPVPDKWHETQAAGLEWLYGFRKRCPDLSLRTPEI